MALVFKPSMHNYVRKSASFRGKVITATVCLFFDCFVKTRYICISVQGYGPQDNALQTLLSWEDRVWLKPSYQNIW